jgi:hypothetical protein
MIYQRSQEIEQRLAEVLRLVRTGRYSTRASAYFYDDWADFAGLRPTA